MFRKTELKTAIFAEIGDGLIHRGTLIVPYNGKNIAGEHSDLIKVCFYEEPANVTQNVSFNQPLLEKMILEQTNANVFPFSIPGYKQSDLFLNHDEKEATHTLYTWHDNIWITEFDLKPLYNIRKMSFAFSRPNEVISFHELHIVISIYWM